MTVSELPRSRVKRPVSIRLISVHDASKVAGVSVGCIRKWVQAHKFPAQQAMRGELGLKRGPATVIAIRYAEFLKYLTDRGIKPECRQID